MPLLIVVAGVIVLLILILAFRLNAFLALILVALGVGIAEGMPVKDALESVQKGVGDTLGSLVLILGFGAMLGNLISESGAAQRITYGLIRRFGKNNLQWAMVLTGFIVGLPMFYTAGFVILIPLVFAVASSAGLPLLYVGVPMAAALSVTHGFLPPHPGPTAIAVIFEADITLTLLYGLCLAVPTIVIAGPLFSRMLKRYKTEPPQNLFTQKQFSEAEMPGYGVSIFTALVPILLMATAAILSLLLPITSPLRQVFEFIGDPVIALLISVLVAIFTLGLNRGKPMSEVMKTVTDSIAGIAMILLIIGGGGALKQVLVDSGVGNAIISLVEDTQLSPLFLAWFIAALLRVCLGSATVAAITAAGIALPLVGSTGVSPELMVLTIGAGSLMFSHVNDPGFWIFKEYFNLTIPQTLATWSIMETIVSVMGLLGVLLLDAFI
ncbi:gluconate permease GntT [Pontibacter ummariensis]|uniref:Gluconate permease GntT n=1 Tax=Pontibacter ummariensis TaxID=1610492 RepID=A0A239KJA8_9BACT|nr:gluconate:H+ symporter [Pontibacter ummariensis]PRY05693.1 gluconate permease GntT [Pontibacter ummariensis]SNT18467.1 gluconate permease GntT [Pontibacter ummariensis]